MPSLARSVPKPLKVPSLARSVPKPLKVPSLARSVRKPLKVPSLARSVPKPRVGEAGGHQTCHYHRCRPPTSWLLIDHIKSHFRQKCCIFSCLNEKEATHVQWHTYCFS